GALWPKQVAAREDVLSPHHQESSDSGSENSFSSESINISSDNEYLEAFR
ncbi:7862_t:CDS:2, partial [Racocetra fulgida]